MIYYTPALLYFYLLYVYIYTKHKFAVGVKNRPSATIRCHADVQPVTVWGRQQCKGDNSVKLLQCQHPQQSVVTSEDRPDTVNMGESTWLVHPTPRRVSVIMQKWCNPRVICVKIRYSRSILRTLWASNCMLTRLVDR